MAQFQAGQKLTAADLNNAFQGVAGVQNPTSDMKWYGTSMGRLQAAWSAFGNSQNAAPKTMDLAVAVDPVDQPGGGGSDKFWGRRRVFVNTSLPADDSLTTIEWTGQQLRVGDMNGMPFIGMLGWQIHDKDALEPGDGDPCFSIWAPSANEPGGARGPQEWIDAQKLWKDDVTRNTSMDNWWWTGITLEHTSKAWTSNLAQGSSPLDIVAYPLMVEVKFKKQDAGREKAVFPVLTVSTRRDAHVRTALFKKRDQIKEALEEAYGEEFGIEVEEISFIGDHIDTLTVATYNYAKDTVNAFYKQQNNWFSFQKDFSANKPGSLLPQNMGADFKNIQWIDRNGHQDKGSEYLNVTDLEGEELDVTDYDVPLEFAVAMAKNKAGEIMLSCVSCDYDFITDGEKAQELLSSIFNDTELSAPLADRRLVLVSYGDARGVQWFDRCPNFQSSGIPDSSALSIGLSSLQEKSYQLSAEGEDEPVVWEETAWSLWEFDNFENSKTYSEIQDNLSAYDLVVRHIDKNEEDTVGIVEYVHLSSLGQLLGGNLPDADVPDAGLSSIQTRTLDDGSKVLELYNFHDPDVETVYLSAQSRYDFVVRDNQDNCVKYANLSGIGGEVTLSGTDGSSGTGSEWKFEAFANSNISVHVSPQTIQLGCYYI